MWCTYLPLPTILKLWIQPQHSMECIPNSKFHGTNMGPIWGRQHPGGPHVGPMNVVIWDWFQILWVMEATVAWKNVPYCWFYSDNVGVEARISLANWRCCSSCGSLRRHVIISSLWPSDAIWWQRSESTLAQVMACCLTAPIHYLNQ